MGFEPIFRFHFPPCILHYEPKNIIKETSFPDIFGTNQKSKMTRNGKNNTNSTRFQPWGATSTKTTHANKHHHKKHHQIHHNHLQNHHHNHHHKHQHNHQHKHQHNDYAIITIRDTAILPGMTDINYKRNSPEEQKTTEKNIL